MKISQPFVNIRKEDEQGADAPKLTVPGRF